MTPEVITASADESINDVLVKMSRHRVSNIVVVRDKRPIGVVSESRILAYMLEEKDFSAPLVEICGCNNLLLQEDRTVIDAVIAMERSGLKAAVITDVDGELSGILTVTDIINRADGRDFVTRQKVKYSMSKHFILAGEMDTVSECVRRMVKMGIDSVIVTAQQEGIGIFTMRDAVRLMGECLCANNKQCSLNKPDENCAISDPVYRHMTQPLVSISGEDFLFEACRKMTEKKIRRIVVVNSKKQPRGIITQKELLRRLDANYSTLMSLAVGESGTLLRLMESDYLPIVESSFEPVLILRGDTVIHLNTKMANLLGVEKTDIRGKKISGIVHADDIHPVKREMAKRMLGNLLDEKFVFRAVKEGRKEIFLECVARRMEEQDGTRTFFLARDITLHKQKERELLRLKEKAEEANISKSAFLASVSHELRTPLTAIIGFGKLICENGNVSEDVKQHSSIVVKQGKSLLLMINKMLEIAKVEKNSVRCGIQELKLARLIENAVSAQKELANRRGVEMNMNIDPQLPETVTADRQRLELALEQLVNNAVKFAGGGGRVIVSASRENASLLFRVSDTGIGIDKKDFDCIFDNFVQLDASINREYCGAGLGLPLAKIMASAMGGDIWLESMPGKGSDFYLSIPCKSGEL